MRLPNNIRLPSIDISFSRKENYLAPEEDVDSKVFLSEEKELKRLLISYCHHVGAEITPSIVQVEKRATPFQPFSKWFVRMKVLTL
jgi:hypothetical protein